MNKTMTYTEWTDRICEDYEFVTGQYVCEQDCDELCNYSSCLQCPHFWNGGCEAAREAYEHDTDD